MSNIFIDTSFLNASNRASFEQHEISVNNTKKSLINDICTELGVLVIMSQFIEYHLNSLLIIYEAVLDKKVLDEVKKMLKENISDSERLFGNAPKPAEQLKILIIRAKRTRIFEDDCLNVLDKLRNNRNHFIHNFFFNNLIKFLKDFSFQKNTIMQIRFTTLCMKQIIQMLYVNLEHYFKNYDEDFLSLMNDLQLTFTLYSLAQF